MTEQQQLVSDSAFSVCVLGRGQEFVLVPLDRDIDSATTKMVTEKCFIPCGVMGILKTGEARAAVAPGMDAESLTIMMRAGLVFAQLAADRLRPTPKDDFVQFAESLFALEDERTA
jgi:hypothetical protein